MSFRATVWAFQQKLPPITKLVLLSLADRHNGDTNRCDPSMERLADDCGLSRESVRKHISELAKRGILNVHPRWDGPVQLTNFYSFNMGGGVASPTGVPNVVGEGVPNQVGTNQEVSNQEVILSVSRDVVEQRHQVVRNVFDYYLDATGKSHLYTLTSKRRQKGLSRLEECLRKTKGNLVNAEVLMKMCVDALVASKFHMGENPQRKEYNNWDEQLFGSEERMEKWLEEAQR